MYLWHNHRLVGVYDRKYGVHANQAILGGTYAKRVRFRHSRERLLGCGSQRMQLYGI